MKKIHALDFVKYVTGYVQGGEIIDIKNIEIGKYIDNKFFVSYDTTYTKNMCKNEIMTSKEIKQLINKYL